MSGGYDPLNMPRMSRSPLSFPCDPGPNFVLFTGVLETLCAQAVLPLEALKKRMEKNR